MIKSAVILLMCVGVAWTVGCGANKSPWSKSCTELGCKQGISVDFSFKERGAYTFEVDVDGVTSTCRANIPLSAGISSACDRPDVQLGLIGAELSVDQQSIGGLELFTTTAKTVTIHGTRDGVLLGNKTMAVAYVVQPGPNGPECEPKECRQATATFP